MKAEFGSVALKKIRGFEGIVGWSSWVLENLEDPWLLAEEVSVSWQILAAEFLIFVLAEFIFFVRDLLKKKRKAVRKKKRKKKRKGKFPNLCVSCCNRLGSVLLEFIEVDWDYTTRIIFGFGKLLKEEVKFDLDLYF